MVGNGSCKQLGFLLVRQASDATNAKTSEDAAETTTWQKRHVNNGTHAGTVVSYTLVCNMPAVLLPSLFSHVGNMIAMSVLVVEGRAPGRCEQRCEAHVK